MLKSYQFNKITSKRNTILILNSISILLLILSSAFVYNSNISFTPENLQLETLDYKQYSKDEFNNFLWSEIVLEDKLIQLRFENLMESVHSEIAEFYTLENQNIIVFKLIDKSWLSFDTRYGKVLRKSSNYNTNGKKQLKVEGWLTEEAEIVENISVLQPLFKNHFDIWNEKLSGTIILLPPIDKHKYLVKYGSLQFTLNGISKKYYYINNIDFAGYIDETGVLSSNMFHVTPVDSSIISSRFNLQRKHPVRKHFKPHLGTDYASSKGAPIYSIGTGTVSKLAKDMGNGLYVKVKHNEDYSSQYLHLDSIPNSISLGGKVDKGQIIGYMGSSGLTTGVHLCFRFWHRGRQIDHTKYLKNLTYDFEKINPIILDTIIKQYSIMTH